MKLYKIFLLLAIFVGTFSSCDDLTELNTDTKNPASVSSASLFSNAQKKLVDRMVSTNVNNNTFRLWAQQWAQTQYTDESNFDLITRNVNGRLWDELLVDVIGNLRESKVVNATEPGASSAHNAICDVLEVYCWHVLVDAFGQIPYTGAFTDELTPTYDDGKFVYGEIAKVLDNAISNLNGDSGLGGADFMYGGDMGAWSKFANSLKLRLAIRIAEDDAGKGATMAKEAVAAGCITSNSENCSMTYLSSSPNTNPLWEDLVESGRTDFVGANTLVDYMNTLADPRRDAFFDANLGFDDNGTPNDKSDDTNIFKGGIAGGGNSYPDFSHVSPSLKDPTFAGTLMNAAEVHFLMADAVERGFDVPGTAEAHYNLGVQQSFDEWGLTQSEADAYLATAGVAYGTAAGTWREKIAMQKYLALYNRGFEAWSTVRMYDAPAMNIAADAGVLPPSRWTFPVSEYSLNGTNVEAAGSAMGGDLNTGKVFWDKN